MSRNSEDLSPQEKLEELHERVNEMLDTPLPAEADAWAVPLDNSSANIPPVHLTPDPQ